ncbi:hypothetical protein FRX31_010694 [Thalictrum thalictroides]|uniref:Uncharacterized protein n=1 Tax=Thalictrum thalictroides TaxID=46969 RepID=A0A7J6WQS2_THATH|nr:hypothetical protein FRX31_010694 [Thalictrum thalictroides]
MAEANARLQHDAKTDYNFEELTGNESEYIEMDLVLGVADLHTPEAVAAAESAMAGSQSVTHVAADICGSDFESDDDDNSVDANTHFKPCSSDNFSKAKYDMDVGLTNGQGKKSKKIVELL